MWSRPPSAGNLDNLTNLDYAFGKPFTIVQSLDAASKALTLQHLTEFAADRPGRVSARRRRADRAVDGPGQQPNVGQRI